MCYLFSKLRISFQRSYRSRCDAKLILNFGRELLFMRIDLCHRIVVVIKNASHFEINIEMGAVYRPSVYDFPRICI